MRSPEGFEKAYIKKFLVANGIWYFAPVTAGFGGSGIPDIVGCFRGKFFSVEVKRPGKAPTALQHKRMAEIEAAGGKTFWGTSNKVIGEMQAWINSL